MKCKCKINICRTANCFSEIPNDYEIYVHRADCFGIKGAGPVADTELLNENGCYTYINSKCVKSNVKLRGKD